MGIKTYDTLPPATDKQKKLIIYINKKMGIPSVISHEIVENINSFLVADQYIKKWYPHVQIKMLPFKKIIKISEFLQEATSILAKK